MKLRFAHSFSCGFITIAVLIMVGEVHGQGTIELMNSVLSRIQYRQCRIGDSPIVTNAPAGMRISVEIGPSPTQLSEVGVPVFTTGEGLFNGGVAYRV